MIRLISPRPLVAVILLFLTTQLAAATFTVTNTNDSGAGSLRKALADAHAAGGGTVAFAIGSGPQTIQPLTPYDNVANVTIDGRTQPGFSGTPLIELDGTLMEGTHVSGVTLHGGAVHALVLNRFPTALHIRGTLVKGCYIGTDRTGTIARGNAVGIGGTGGTIEHNLISGNGYGLNFGILITPSIVRRNNFGTTVTGEALLGPANVTGTHIFANRTPTMLIEDNVFGGAQSYAIELFYNDNATIRANYIGQSRGGNPLPGRVGVHIYQSSNNAVIGNRIVHHSLAGILLIGNSLRNTITNNRLENNGIGIDLSTSYTSDGVTPNDAGDDDDGPNAGLNFPVITRVTSIGGASTITGTFDSTPNRDYTVELFSSPSCHSSGHGEGRLRIASIPITTDGNGHAGFTHGMGSLTPGHVITATATSSLEGTSEFSRCTAVEGRGAFRFSAASVSIQESQPSGNFVIVERAAGAVGTATVNYATSDGTAKAGADYSAASGMLTFADGETAKTIDLAIVNDSTHEGAQTFTIKLSNPTGATLGGVSTETVTILDNDPRPSLWLPEVAKSEGNSGTTSFVFTATLQPASEATHTITYSTADGTATVPSDYTSAFGTLVFAPGETSKTFTVDVHGDTLRESDEYFWLFVSYDGKNAGTRFISIYNDEASPRISASVAPVRESDSPQTVLVTLSAPEPVYATLYVYALPGTAVEGDDYQFSFVTVTFNGETTKTLPLIIAGDDQPENEESFTIGIESPGWDPANHDESLTVTITDDDAGIGPEKLLVPVGESRRAVIQVGDAAATDQTFQVVSSNPSWVSAPATVILPAGSTRVTFDVEALEASRKATLTVTTPPIFGSEATVIRVSTYTKVELTLSPSELTLHPGQTVTIDATLLPANTEPVLIGLTATDGVEVPDSFTIPAGGHGSFPIEALQKGTFIVTATLPAAHGSETVSVAGRVGDAPVHPALTSISPANGSIAGGTSVEVHGALLRADCTVTFGGVPASAVTFVSEALLTVTTPAHAAGAVDVTLLCGADTATLPHAFVYRGAGPSLIAIAPSTGSTAGGTFVRITGNDILPGCWPFFDDVPSPRATVRDASTITAVVPPHAAGAVDVRLLCTGTDALLTGAFTYAASDDPSAQIVNVEPWFGAPGDVVTLTGTGFRFDDAITFGNVRAIALDSTPESHTVVVPEVTPGVVAVEIVRGVGFVMSTTGPVFTVGEPAPPRVSRVLPASVAVGGEVVLEGTSFRAPYTFAFHGKTASIVSLLPSRAVVRLANDLLPGTYPTLVMNAANKIASVGPAVNIRPEGVVVSAIDKPCGATDGGIDVVLTGSGFAAGAAVMFDDVPATNVAVLDPTKVQARTPPNSAGPATIRVTNPDGSTSTLTNAFRYASPFDPHGCNAPATTGRTRAVRH